MRVLLLRYLYEYFTLAPKLAPFNLNPSLFANYLTYTSLACSTFRRNNIKYPINVLKTYHEKHPNQYPLNPITMQPLVNAHSTCPKCSATVQGGSKTCSSCGAVSLLSPSPSFLPFLSLPASHSLRKTLRASYSHCCCCSRSRLAAMWCQGSPRIQVR
jgi:hypothetical protein